MRGRILIAALLLGGCSRPPSPALPVPDSVPAPNPQAIESVLFVIGDAGDVVFSSSPTLARLQQDIEWWSAELAADSAVAVLLLGDNLYPEGVRPPGSSAYDGDTAVVMSQVRLVAGPSAVSRRAQAYFLAGNHDWGLKEHREGFVRLVNLTEVLELGRLQTGANVMLAPPAGTGGPFVVDWGSHTRLLLLDSAWWILSGNSAEKDAVLEAIEEAMETAGGRQVMLAAHHPFKSAGPHGGQFSFWRTIGFRYLLHRSGAILQNLTSRPFRQLEFGLRDTFRRQGVPLAFLGGHDHSLQVIAGDEPTDPLFSLVSGSGSKLSEVGMDRPVLFGHMAPGYMRILIGHDGSMTLHVEAVEAEYLKCPSGEPQRATCMAAGIAGFRTVFWTQLR